MPHDAQSAAANLESRIINDASREQRGQLNKAMGVLNKLQRNCATLSAIRCCIMLGQFKRHNGVRFAPAV